MIKDGYDSVMKQMHFRLRSSMCQFVQLNVLNKENLFNEQFNCKFCGLIESQRHFQTCFAYSKFRENTRLDSPTELAEFYRNIIKYRQQCEDNNDLSIFDDSIEDE